MITCDVALEVLQCRLDGSAQPVDPAIALHLRQCVECRSRFAAADMLLSVYAPRVPADFTVRLRSAVYSDARRRSVQRWMIGATGLAAALLLALRLGLPQPLQQPEVVVAANVPSIETRVSGAKSAIWNWGGQTLSLMGMPEIADPRINSGGIEQSIEPATAALTSAGKGLVDGVEPLASSAKRATQRFWRDLPTN